MPVSIEEVARAKDTRIKEVRTVEDLNGNTLVLEPGEKLIIDSVTAVTCDGPRCKGGENGLGDAQGPTTYQWSQLAVQTDPAALPDGTARLLILEVGSMTREPKKMVFCSPRCIADYFLSPAYVKPLSPREEAAMQKANLEAAAKKATEQQLAALDTPIATEAAPAPIEEKPVPAELLPEDGA